MATSAKQNDATSKPAVIGSRQAVEAAIDAAKLSENQTWEQAAQKSRSIPPWHGGECRHEKPQK